MPFVRSLAFKRRAYVITVILLLSKIMPTYSYCVLKGLVYIAIMAPLNRQPSSCTKYTKLNMRSSCDVRLVSNAECTCFTCSCVLRSLRLPCLICLRVLCDSYCGETRF